jgi:YgiT-type zinc finger domain-containing protein
VERYRRIIRAHVYDKCWQLDITWAEVEQLLDDSDVVEARGDDEGRSKRVRLLEGWKRPLHVVEVVDDEQELVVYVTIYEPDLNHWLTGFRERRRAMKCVVCNQGDTFEELRPRVVEREGRVAVVRNVPILVCNACGEVYLDAVVAKQLDLLFRQLLDGPVDHVVGHFEQAVA